MKLNIAELYPKYSPLLFSWYSRKEGDWRKKTPKAESAASSTSYVRLLLGFLISGRERKTLRIVCTSEFIVNVIIGQSLGG